MEMIRAIALIAICTAIIVAAASIASSLAIPIALSLYILIQVAPNYLRAVKAQRFERRIERWMIDKGIVLKYVGPERRYFTRGKLRKYASTAQLIFSLKNGEMEYWFACGSWWFGAYSNRISIYEANQDAVVLKEKIYA
jgi:hypothetical protein